MADLIDRQAAIDALHMHLMYRMGTDSNKKRLDDWINGVPSAQPDTHWIPCSERMPVEGQKCLVYDKAIGFRVDVYIGHGNPFNWELFVRDYEAWMPLPKPYRGGEE